MTDYYITFIRNMTNTSLNETNDQDGRTGRHPGFYVIVIIAAVAIVINAIFLIMCYKTQKKLHTVLTLSLCLCDIFQAASIIVFMFTFDRANPIFCRLNVGLIWFSSMSFFCILFLLGLERLLATTVYHIRIRGTLQNFKYLIINGSLALAFCYMMVMAFLIPGNDTIAKCSITTLYESYSGFVLISVYGPIVLTLLLIILITLATGVRISRRYLEKRKKTISKLIQNYANQTGKFESDICTVTKHSYQSSPEGITQPNSTVTESGNDKIENEFIASLQRSNPIQGKLNKDHWEIRALKTLILICLTTTIFNVPFISTFVVEFIFGFIGREVRLVTIIPYVLNGILDPFIYAWRNPEIRGALRISRGNN